MSDFSDLTHTLPNGLTGEILPIHSANPTNYYQALNSPTDAPAQLIYGQLFSPSGSNNPVVIVVPGSLGVADSHLAHCTSLTDAGIAALAIDPFGERQVSSTVANQAQFSFAASSWDVLAAASVMADHPAVKSDSIGAQGHSRGGTAVVNAAVESFPKALKLHSLCAVYAAYPWCGFQFRNPEIGATTVRSIIGDQDEWCLPQQVQAYMQAMRLCGGSTSCRIVPNAHHSFDHATPVTLVEDASVAPAAPTTYLADDGCFIHPVDGKLPPQTSDREVMLYGVKSGRGVRGAHIGSTDDQAQLFTADMLGFWREQF